MCLLRFEFLDNIQADVDEPVAKRLKVTTSEMSDGENAHVRTLEDTQHYESLSDNICKRTFKSRIELFLNWVDLTRGDRVGEAPVLQLAPDRECRKGDFGG